MITLPETHGSRVVKFIEKFCVHGEGDFYGEPVRLDDWQKAIIYELYELNNKGQRKYREALIGTPKGNGKTAIVSMIGLYELLGTNVTSPLVAVAAASFEQANLCFGNMRTVCEQSPYLRDMVETYENVIQVKNGSGRAFRVAAKAGTADGGRNSCFIADEIH
jgi:phage terminase large subunit-like protein